MLSLSHTKAANNTVMNNSKQIASQLTYKAKIDRHSVDSRLNFHDLP